MSSSTGRRRDPKAARVPPILSELPIIIEDHGFTTGRKFSFSA